MPKKKGTRRRPGEGTVYQRKDKRWVAEITLEDGNRKSYYFKTEKDAVEAKNQLLHEMKQGMLATGPQQTVKQYLEHWLENVHKLRIREGSYIRYRKVLDKHLLPALGHIRLQKLAPEHIDRYYATKIKAGISARTLHLHHAILHRALDDAVRRNLIARNPCDLVDRPRAIKHEPQPLNQEQAQKLLEAARGGKLEGMLTMALITGMRHGELTGLQWKDIDFEHNLLQIRRTVNYYSGGYGYIVSEPKTSRSRRKISLSPLLVDVLKRHRARQLELRLQAGAAWVDHDLVFCTRVGGFLHPTVVRNKFRRILQQAGLPSMRFHDLRHSAATILLTMGIHPKIVQELLGHSSISITLDIYSSVIPSLQQEAVEKISTLFQQAE